MKYLPDDDSYASGFCAVAIGLALAALALAWFDVLFLSQSI